MQHRTGRVVLGIVLQRLACQCQAVYQVASEKGQSAAQERDGLVDTFGVASHTFMAQQVLQALQADARAGEVVGDDDGGGFGDGQGEMIAATLFGLLGEEVDYGVDLSFAQQGETMALDGRQHRIEVLGPAELVDGLRVSLVF
ncbi:hypothetical protein D9M68_671880 [compost metagenome]